MPDRVTAAASIPGAEGAIVVHAVRGEEELSRAFEYRVEGMITACDPAMCQFAEADAPCVIGDRDTDRYEQIVVDGDEFTTTAEIAEGLCARVGVPQIATWTRVTE